MPCTARATTRSRALSLHDALPISALSPASDVEPTRDSWQRPAYVMDELGITPGSSVADVGAGDGYFTMHLADRVGEKGAVYAVDIRSEEHTSELQSLRHLVCRVLRARPLGAALFPYTTLFRSQRCLRHLTWSRPATVGSARHTSWTSWV